MAIDPMIARGSPGLDVTNTLMRVGMMKQRDQAIQQDDEEDARWLQAIQTGDWPSAFKIDPQATQAFQMHKQQ